MNLGSTVRYGVAVNLVAPASRRRFGCSGGLQETAGGTPAPQGLRQTHREKIPEAKNRLT
jgi:hypothetical protein